MHNAWTDIAYWRGNYYLFWDDKYVETRVVYTEDGQSWSEPQRVYEPGANFWRPKVHTAVSFIRGLIYVASDDGGERVDLLRSADGLTWEKVSTIVEGSQSQGGGEVTETAIAFWPDGELWALTRQNILSRARPPYTDWTNEPAFPEGNPWIGGPEIIRIGNDIYAAGRTYPVVAVSDKYNGRATSLWKSDQGTDRFEWIADLPKAAHTDTGYAGFLATEEGVYVVYYSGHAYEEEEEEDYAVKTDIYLVKLNIGRGDLDP